MFEKDQLEKAPPLAGKFDSIDDMTELERAVAEHQGLVTPDGTLKEEARRQPKKLLDLPAHIGPPVRLEDLTPDAGEINQGIAEMKARLAKETKPTKTAEAARLDQPLPPPSFDDAVSAPNRGTDLPMPDTDTANVFKLIAEAKEPVNCGHCGWDVRQSFQPPKVTEEDRMAFVRHVMSRHGRFCKTYRLFDALSLELRSVSQTESDEMIRQLRRDAEKERIKTGGEFSVQLQRYQVAASVRRVIAHSGDADERIKDISEAEVFPTLDEVRKSGVDEPARHLEGLVIGESMPTGLYSALVAAWLEFSRVYGWLSSHAHESSFWKAVAGSRS